jgi:hypothetical protein
MNGRRSLARRRQTEALEYDQNAGLRIGLKEVRCCYDGKANRQIIKHKIQNEKNENQACELS